VLIVEPEPISGVIKNCKVVCQPNELKEYEEGVKVVVVSEKLFYKLMSNLSQMEEDLTKLKEMNLNETIRNIEEIRAKIETHLRELSYEDYVEK
jgi:reverse gyrase